MTSAKPAKMNGTVGGVKPSTAGNVNMFTAMPLSEIQPELIAYGPDGLMVTIDHKADSKTVVQTLKKENLLEFPRVVFITHGFWGNSKSRWIHDLKAKFLEESDQTFIIVGWGNGAELPAYKYPQVVVNALPVGQWLSNHILELKRKIGNKIKIWGIGEGIGAHVMGIAGRSSHAFTRITGKIIYCLSLSLSLSLCDKIIKFYLTSI